MKKIIFVFAGALFVYSCNPGKRGAESEQNAAALEAATNSIIGQELNQEQFIGEAASGGMMEARLGKMASEKAINEEVKQFGKMMVQDHSQANDRLKTILSGSGLEMPQEMPEHRQKIEEMQNVSGEEFDQAYMQMMVEDHKEDISKFQKAQGKMQNDQLNAWVEQTLPILRQHLQRAEVINENLQGNQAIKEE